MLLFSLLFIPFIWSSNGHLIWNYRQIDGLAPTFAKKPAIKQEDDGRRLIFECKITADPQPAVSWYHNGTAIEASSRYKVR